MQFCIGLMHLISETYSYYIGHHCSHAYKHGLLECWVALVFFAVILTNIASLSARSARLLFDRFGRGTESHSLYSFFLHTALFGGALGVELVLM